MAESYLLRGGLVVDGTGADPLRADVILRDGKIEEVKRGGCETVPDDARVIDVSGKIVAPGFIDMHSHSDLALFRPEGVGIKLAQGVTTELLGQDGLSVAPLAREDQPLWRDKLSGLLGEEPSQWNWETVGEYFDAVDSIPPEINVCYLLPHGPIRAAVVGNEDVPTTAADRERMGQMILDGMAEGACGLSTGLIYQPCSFADRDELADLNRYVAEAGGFFVVHMRNESHRVLESFAEMRYVAEQSGCPLHISHLKVAGLDNAHLWPQLLGAIDDAREAGLDVTFDQYPYAAGSTMLDALLPNWVHGGGPEAVIARLRDPEIRDEIFTELTTSEDLGEEENMYARGGPESVMVTWVKTDKNAWVIGKTLAEIADGMGKHPVVALMDLLAEERLAATMISFWGREEDIIPAMQHPAGLACTDGIYGPHPHPRLGGSFPRILGEFVRERRALTLPQAVYRMTSASAARLGLNDRGVLSAGKVADVVVFDADTIESRASYEEPLTPPRGIEYVFVNGTLAVDDGAPTGARGGRALRSG
ncbi:MAG: N-acyl-D-amino-acid deacylase family protein [Clostridia bacterium]